MTTRWYPDTCGCVFDVDDVTGMPSNIVQRCARHGADVLGAAAVADNRRKNKAGALLDPAFPDAWSFAYLADGTLQISLPSATLVQKSTLSTTLATQVGGKLAVV